MLMDHYPNFLKDIERVKILSQILIYCVYYQKDQAKLLYFLQKFMDQPFDNAFKYRHLNVSKFNFILVCIAGIFSFYVIKKI